MNSPLAQLNALTLLDSLTLSVAAIDIKGNIAYANPAFCDLSGYTESELQGQAWNEWLTFSSKTDCTLCMGVKALNLNPLDIPLTLLHNAFLRVQTGGTAQELRVKIKHSPLPPYGILCLVEPFSEDTILTQAHNDFVSTVSHEFRTPLTSIKGFSDTLLNYGTQLPDEEKRRFIHIIKDQADRLIRLVENLLTASKVGAGRVEMSYRPVLLPKLLDKVTHSIQAKLQGKNQGKPFIPHRFEVAVHSDSMAVWADADRLEQVLINLVDNAVKYSLPGTRICIKGEFLPEDDGWIRIRIEDEGVGIPAELLPRIFTKFYRAEGPLKQEVEGAGLGLYITQSLTTAMGGRIEAISQPGQGTTFILTFPAATPERQAAHRRKLSMAEANEE